MTTWELEAWLSARMQPVERTLLIFNYHWYFICKEIIQVSSFCLANSEPLAVLVFAGPPVLALVLNFPLSSYTLFHVLYKIIVYKTLLFTLGIFCIAIRFSCNAQVLSCYKLCCMMWENATRRKSCYRVRTGHGKSGKSWHFRFPFSGLESHENKVIVTERHGKWILLLKM